MTRRRPEMNPRARYPVSLLWSCCALWLAACSPTILTEPPRVAPPLPDRSVEDGVRYQVVPADTRVYARVFRGGRLEKLGHNHIVVFNDVQGYVSVPGEQEPALFDLAVAAADVSIDPPDLRRAQGPGFEAEISDRARAGTRENMLGESILDAAAYPFVMISSTSVDGSLDAPRITMTVAIRNQTRPVTVPVSLTRDNGRLVAEGEFEILQTDFGIEPFSALGGALKVKDRIELVFTIVAERAESN